jgi:PmbA protein
MTIDIKNITEKTLQRMQEAGFDDCHISIGISEQDELNVAHNEPSLLRSTEDYSVSLMGIIDGRKAGATLTDIGEQAIAAEVTGLFDRAQSAPQDDANTVSSGQTGHFEQGPLSSNLDLLAEKTIELLEYRAKHTPKVTLEEGGASHSVSRSYEMTSQGTRLSSTVGCYQLMAMGTASEDGRSSSFNYTGGRTSDLRQKHASEWFAIGEMLADTQNQIDTQPLDSRFTGEVILAPSAVSDLVGWLLGQLGSSALISKSSIYEQSVAELIAAPALSIRSYFDAPGHVPYTSDGFLAKPLDIVAEGKLTTLLPDLYGSRKTGLAHTPSTSGWRVDPGTDHKADLIASVNQGALVNRLSMGSPAANGDFSGVIKNSFVIRDGKIGAALADTMVNGNMSNMLLDISGVSAEHLDYGGEDYPWLRIPNMHFS